MEVNKVASVVAVISTVIGVAATLGFGTAQINDGMSYLFGVPSSLLMQFGFVVTMTMDKIENLCKRQSKMIMIINCNSYSINHHTR